MSITEVHKINVKLKVNKCERERESRVLSSPLSAQGQLDLIPKIHSTRIIIKQETTALKNKDNLSSVGTDHPPNH